MGRQIFLHLPKDVPAAEKAFQGAELPGQRSLLFVECRKVAVQVVKYGLGIWIAEDPGEQFAAQFPGIEGNKAGFLHGVFGNLYFFHGFHAAFHRCSVPSC